MKIRPSRTPLSLLGLALLAFAPGCELIVNPNASLDASVSTVLDCGICADVSVDADYDAADVSIYGLPPSDEDAGHAADAGDAGDARVDAHD